MINLSASTALPACKAAMTADFITTLKEVLFAFLLRQQPEQSLNSSDSMSCTTHQKIDLGMALQEAILDLRCHGRGRTGQDEPHLSQVASQQPRVSENLLVGRALLEPPHKT